MDSRTPLNLWIVLLLALALPVLLAGCTPTAAADDDDDDDVADDDSAGDDDTASDDDTAGDDDSQNMPSDPSPFTITFSGSTNEAIVFNYPTCEQYPDPSFVNFRNFWRGDHNGVLIVEVLGTFAGPGTYDESMGMVRAKLQAESPQGSPYDFFYQTDSTQGDTVSITVEYIDADVAWGTFTIGGMSDGQGGSVTASPAEIPIWCPDVWD